MLIQIFGAGFHNRGAQLMLWTAVQRLRAISSDVRFAVETDHSNFRQRAEYDLRTLVPTCSARRPSKTAKLVGVMDWVSRSLPKSLEKEYGLARRCDADAFIDISGYAFGDKWPPVTIRSVAARVSHYAKQKKPTILLPQMFGPFEKPETRAAFQPILEKANLIYAREQASYEELTKINSTNRQLERAPDITIFSGSLPPTEPAGGSYACLVPNMRMRDKAADTWGDIYVEAMVRAIRKLQQLSIKPFVVIHDGGEEDIIMGQEIADQAGLPPEQIYREQDPRRIKGFLAGAQMTIGSRFHALVSSLSMGTPAIALGWAHKYEALLGDFGVPELCCHHSEGANCTIERIEKLTESTSRDPLIAAIENKKQAMQAENDRMWNEVAGCLGLTA